MTFREKLEHARKQFNKQNAKTSANLRNAHEEPFLSPQEATEKRKSKAIHPDQMFNSIFQQMKEEEGTLSFCISKVSLLRDFLFY